MHTKILLFLGANDEYLGYKSFQTDEDMDKYANLFVELIILNIQKELPLRKRLFALPKGSDGEPLYFPLAGALQGFDYIDLIEDET